MVCGHESTISEFLRVDEDTLIGKLTNAVATTGVGSQWTAQIEAWQVQIRHLKEQLDSPQFVDWHIILEYEIPRDPVDRT